MSKFKKSSWSILADNVIIKSVDKSIFKYNGTNISVYTKKFWGIEHLGFGQHFAITLSYRNRIFSARFQKGQKKPTQTRLFWHSDFAKEIAVYNIDTNDPIYMRFEKQSNSLYIVNFIDSSSIIKDAEIDILENQYAEGEDQCFWGVRYERNPQARLEAIKVHGAKCCVCGFDFESFYGTRGAGYIEIHHINPLSATKKRSVNPNTDLIPVCSNCHRMIHRTRNTILSIEELKNMVFINKEENES